MPGTMFPFDEVNRLKEKWSASKLTKADKDWLFDDLIDLFLIAYTKGCEQVMDDVPGTVPYFGGADKAIWTEVAGEYWDDRLIKILEPEDDAEEPKTPGVSQSEPGAPTVAPDSPTAFTPGSTDVIKIEPPETRPILPDLIRLVDTEAHRIYCTGEEDTAVRNNLTTKTWKTMEDLRVRDTHSYLEGVSAPVGGLFTTYDGDSARFPGDFKNAENNVNCRCYLTYS